MKERIRNLTGLFIRFLLIFAIVFACADRKRNNPLDPKNPETLGKPHGLRVFSELDEITLSWNSISLSTIRGYRIYRRTEGQQQFVPIKDVGSDSTMFIDKNVTFNKRYWYTITILGEDFESAPGDTVWIIPGPTSIFVADVYNRYIFKLSHDCAHEIYHIPVDGYPWQLDLDESTNQIWFTDVLFNEIIRLNLADQSQVVLATFYYGDPVDIVIDEKNNLVWTADQDSGVVHIFNRNGLKLKEIPDFTKISDIDCYFADGTCWVADYKQKKLFRIKKNFSLLPVQTEFSYPFRISVNQSDGTVWVLDENKLKKLNVLGKVIFVVDYDFNDPYALDVDSENGNCWVIDWFKGKDNSKILCFDSNGKFLFEKDGYTYPENLVVNPENHGCIIADSGGGRVAKTDSLGNVLGTTENLYYPYGLLLVYER